MKKVSITLAGILAASMALPAVAGPNWTVIREAQIHKAAHEQQEAAKGGMAADEVMPLDHGPRALSTPWLNKERELEILAEARKKTSVFASHSAPSSSVHS